MFWKGYIILELYNISGTKETEKGATVRPSRPLTESEKKAAGYEAEAIKIAEEEKDYAKALGLLNLAVESSPSYPSPYNNRAQVYRLQNKLDLAILDLDRAIELSQDFPNVKQQALCQRAWIRHAANLMEDAYADFQEAGRLGNEDARRMAVRCNPYAQLCNNIMQEMIGRLYYSQPS